ncbi:MAG: cytochrome c biogenesis protein CcsA [Pyrinomonadaceae bacterium]
MRQEAMQAPVMVGADVKERKAFDWRSYTPIFLVIIGSFLMLLGRIYLGGGRFITDGALMMLALASYLLAAVFYITNLYAPFPLAEKLGMWGTALGVFFNLSSWLVRWVAAYDRELAIFQQQGRDLADMPWMFRYVPFANLYDLSLAFAFGAGIATLFVIRKPQFKIVAALSLPLAAIILVLARFIGGEFIDLPPVLDSYWRPIHVGIASLSYGTALVCFAVAVLYLLKDGVKPQTMSIWSNIFAISVFATISKFSVFAPVTFGQYSVSLFSGDSRMALALRADVPYVGWLLVASAVLLGAASFCYLFYISGKNKTLKSTGFYLMLAALFTQAAAIGTLVYQVRHLSDIATKINPIQYTKFATWMLQQQGVSEAQIQSMGSAQLTQIATSWIQSNGSTLHASLNSNPVELSALITAFIGTFFVIMFCIKTGRIRAALPSADVLDALMYKLAGITFAGLALLLITGAVWANESWGRYWGWDAKEVGALVAWLTYAAFLHSRIAKGWSGRKSAYFALIAFLFIIFTFLGVSYLLPGLHSYA